MDGAQGRAGGNNSIIKCVLVQSWNEKEGYLDKEKQLNLTFLKYMASI